jgi:hypothetical protein
MRRMERASLAETGRALRLYLTGRKGCEKPSVPGHAGLAVVQDTAPRLCRGDEDGVFAGAANRPAKGTQGHPGMLPAAMAGATLAICPASVASAC